jgi:hypothetical protein
MEFVCLFVCWFFEVGYLMTLSVSYIALDGRMINGCLTFSRMRTRKEIRSTWRNPATVPQ